MGELMVHKEGDCEVWSCRRKATHRIWTTMDDHSLCTIGACRVHERLMKVIMNPVRLKYYILKSDSEDYAIGRIEDGDYQTESMSTYTRRVYGKR
jgi:hypothetical protein